MRRQAPVSFESTSNKSSTESNVAALKGVRYDEAQARRGAAVDVTGGNQTNLNPGNRRAVLAALMANFGIAIAKFVGYAITGAASMLAEAVHSVADTGNQALLLWGGAQAGRRPDSKRPFGYGTERYFWAFVVALVIFSLGGLFALYEGVQKLMHPHPLNAPEVALAILAVGILLEGLSFWTAVREARAIKGETSWWAFVRHTKNPELPVVLLEDLGALSGLIIAMIGIGAATLTGDVRYDAAGSVAIGALLLGIAVILAIEMKSLLIGESANLDMQDRIREALLDADEVQRLLDMRTLHLGPDRLLVGAKIEFRASLSFAQLADAINAVEARIRDAVPIARNIYIEPDVFRPDEPDES